jgi:hypothetical protein
MNVEIRTVAVPFLFWEYMFLIFVISFLECGPPNYPDGILYIYASILS